MFSLELESDDAAKDLLIADLWEQGTAGIVETELPAGRWLLLAFFEPEADAAFLLRFFALHNPSLTNHPHRNWVAESRAAWEPIAVGRRFYLVPEWRDDPAPAGRLRIAINPGLACGTGYHEATQLCLEAIEQYATPATVVLDIGAGAGILSIASALIGSAKVIACDVDPVAVDIAGVAFRRAGVMVLLFTGSATSIRSGIAGLIVANISAATSIELAPEFLRCLAPAGRCIVSGFETVDAAAVEATLERAGSVIERRLIKGQWCALAVRRSIREI
jgi:ribosomal protein L11 methyltransferase